MVAPQSWQRIGRVALEPVPVFFSPELSAQFRIDYGKFVGRAIEMNFGHVSEPNPLPAKVCGMHYEQVAAVSTAASIENQDSHNAPVANHGEAVSAKPAIPNAKPFSLRMRGSRAASDSASAMDS